jgi:hypothetical protein
MTRLQYNKLLLGKLEDLIHENKDLRFSQILDVYGFVRGTRPANPEHGVDWVNEFYMEPQELLTRVEKRIRDRGNNGSV